MTMPGFTHRFRSSVYFQREQALLQPRVLTVSRLPGLLLGRVVRPVFRRWHPCLIPVLSENHRSTTAVRPVSENLHQRRRS
jgi:hypothetical protein